MIVADSRLKQLKADFAVFRINLFTLRRIHKLLDLAGKQIPKAFTINGERISTSDEILYRSIIYTLFYANFQSVSLIANLERLPTEFNYIDAKLILRAILERCITQKFILTDPKRLASMFLAWGEIEYKRFHSSYEEIQQRTEDSLALDMDFAAWFSPWTNEREVKYQEFVAEWESLVRPKQDANKAKSWSGHSVAEMAKLAGLEDIYKLNYRETSWYTHGLISVADFFLRQTDNGMEYSSSTSRCVTL